MLILGSVLVEFRLARMCQDICIREFKPANFSWRETLSSKRIISVIKFEVGFFLIEVNLTGDKIQSEDISIETYISE